MVERDALEAGDIRTIPIPEPSEEMLGKAVELYEHIKYLVMNLYWMLLCLMRIG